RKSKIDPVEKVKIVERLLADEVGVREAAQSIGVDPGIHKRLAAPLSK
ncbi:hypothetical protein HMP0721_2487, partial [Pseudoramibacter alactolyticus ATCC 23263]